MCKFIAACQAGDAAQVEALLSEASVQPLRELEKIGGGGPRALAQTYVEAFSTPVRLSSGPLRTTWEVGPAAVAGSEAVVPVTVRAEGHSSSQTVRYVLVREDGEWRLHGGETLERLMQGIGQEHSTMKKQPGLSPERKTGQPVKRPSDTTR
jgi:hypothetical protein